jgi:hypothetical protein
MTESLVNGSLKERSTPFWSPFIRGHCFNLLADALPFFVLSGGDDVSTLSCLSTAPDDAGLPRAGTRQTEKVCLLACDVACRRFLFFYFAPPTSLSPAFPPSSHHLHAGSTPWPFPSFGGVSPGRQSRQCIFALCYAVQAEISLLIPLLRVVTLGGACRTPWLV